MSDDDEPLPLRERLRIQAGASSAASRRRPSYCVAGSISPLPSDTGAAAMASKSSSPEVLEVIDLTDSTTPEKRQGDDTGREKPVRSKKRRLDPPDSACASKSEPFIIEEELRSDGFSVLAASYGDAPEKALTRRCWVAPSRATLTSVKTAVIEASRLEYTPPDVTLKARFSDADDPQRLGTDKRIQSFLTQSHDLAVRDADGRVCLCVSALNDEESELLITLPRWPPSLPTVLAAITLPPRHPEHFTADDKHVLETIASEYVDTRRLPFPAHRDDWLAQYTEEHEDVRAMIRWSARSSGKQGGAICILPIECDGDQHLPLDAIVRYAEAFFDQEITLLPPVKLVRPDDPAGKATLLGTSVDYRTFVEASGKVMPHGQFCATHVLKAVSNRRVTIPGLPPTFRSLLAITMGDLYINESDDFTQGLAWSPVCVFSFLRYTSAFDETSGAQRCTSGKSSKGGGKGQSGKSRSGSRAAGLVANRGAKTAVHEILHVFGLGHCTYAYCLMNGSGHLLEDYAIPHTLCAVCTAKTKLACGPAFSLRRRLDKLLAFCAATEGFEEEADEFRQLIRRIGK